MLCKENPQIVWGQFSFSVDYLINKMSFAIMYFAVRQLQYICKGGKSSLSHTKWNCKYHIVFAPKYRRKEFYGINRLEIGKILRKLCELKDVNIITAEVCSDHVHMFVEIPPKVSISSFMGFLKDKSSVMIYSRWGNMKYKYRNRSFWCRDYYVDTVGKNEVAIR